MLMTNEEHQGFGSGPFTIVLAEDHWVFGVSMWGWGGLAMVIGTRKGLPSFQRCLAQRTCHVIGGTQRENVS